MIKSLSPGLLNEFAAELRRLGAPVVDVLEPGLGDEEIDSLLKPAGIELPEEARVWWRWRNGTDPNAEMSTRLFGGRYLNSLTDEAEAYLERVRISEGGLEGFLQPLSGRPNLYFDCRGPRDAPVVPVHRRDDIEPPRRILPSIGSLVLEWIAIFRSGAVTVDHDGFWHYDTGLALELPHSEVVLF